MSTQLPANLSGTVTRFKGNGRKLGYPTANLSVETDLKDGVYFGFADMAEWRGHPALIFVGTPTTVGDTERRVEAYLLDITDQDYYGEQLALNLVEYHRPNQTFDNLEELIKAMHTDESVARQFFNSGSGRI
ncbi:MAG TPA: riboflavin kinase [Candidatus Saccharimonadia bacterium]|nr:riboflavin kinase [Candidatus Saccharimonadia bacterium]